MNLNVNRDWLLRMAEKEGNGCASVGGLYATLRQATTIRCRACGQPIRAGERYQCSDGEGSAHPWCLGGFATATERREQAVEYGERGDTGVEYGVIDLGEDR